MGSLRYIKDKVETQVHRDMQRMIDYFLEMPDSDDDLAVWYQRADFRCAAAFASSTRARWPQLAAAYIKHDSTKNSPSPSVSLDDAEPFQFSNENNLQTYPFRANCTSTESSFWKISSGNIEFTRWFFPYLCDTRQSSDVCIHILCQDSGFAVLR